MRRQHGVVSRAQLLRLGFSRDAIRHRLEIGRLHPVRRGVYAVGRPELTRHGGWMAAVLACGDDAALSHRSAAALWGLIPRSQVTEVAVPAPRHPRPPGVRVHTSADLTRREIFRRDGIPVTSPVRTLIDLAVIIDEGRLEAAVIAADKLDLVGAERLRAEVAKRDGVRGAPALRRLLDERTFAVTDSVLERRFLRVVRDAKLPRPETGARVEGFEVDFLWRDLGLIVETDGLRYHRTPSQQARDHRRDQVHSAAGLETIRFTHAQVTKEPGHVAATLAAVIARRRAA